MRVAFKHRLANEVSEVEAVADQGAPAEQVGQTQPPEPLIALIIINYLFILYLRAAGM